jgi:hypothetical protein
VPKKSIGSFRGCAVSDCQNPAKIVSFQSSYRPHKPRSRHMGYNQSTNKSIHHFELAECEIFPSLGAVEFFR